MSVGTLPPRKGQLSTAKTSLFAWLWPALTSTVGCKYLMALTGWALIGFLFAHLAGNLLVFKGQDALNSYAQALKDLGPGLWVLRIGLLTVFVVHIAAAVALTNRNRAARPDKYQHPNTVQASIASRTMFLSGLVILAFVIYHLLHFTFGTVQSGPGGVNMLDLKDPFTPGKVVRHDVYTMVTHGFSNIWVLVSYIVAQLVLGLHLSHGISSTFQSLGWNGPRYWPVIRMVGLVLTVILVAGNVLMPIMIYLSGRT